jgi:FkbM family methyltransferase
MNLGVIHSLPRALETKIVRVVSLAPSRLIDLVVRTLLKSQGKGWGSVTIKEEIRQIDSLLGDTNPDLVIFDVGANVGKWSLEAIQKFPKAHVYAFEPSKRTFEVLSSAVAGTKNIVPMNLAIAGKSGTATLYSDKELSGLASLKKRRLGHFDLYLDYSEEIKTVTLEQMVNELKVIPQLLKIDAEGLELEILNSGAEVVSRIPVIQFEFGGSNLDSQTTFQDFWYFFTNRGFDIFRITPNGPRQLFNYSELDEIYLTTNYIAIKLLTNE